MSGLCPVSRVSSAISLQGKCSYSSNAKPLHSPVTRVSGAELSLALSTGHPPPCPPHSPPTSSHLTPGPFRCWSWKCPGETEMSLRPREALSPEGGTPVDAVGGLRRTSKDRPLPAPTVQGCRGAFCGTIGQKPSCKGGCFLVLFCFLKTRNNS